MFPDWFAEVQPDWPPQVKLTGFPLYDERGTTEVPAGVSKFLDSGEPPVVFVAGSGNQQAERFFRAAVDGCARSGCRGLLLTRYPAQVPTTLPTTVRHFDYVPLSQVLPRAAVFVHHGGIGLGAAGEGLHVVDAAGECVGDGLEDQPGKRCVSVGINPHVLAVFAG